MWISRKKLKEKREHSYNVGYHDGIAHQYYKQRENGGTQEGTNRLNSRDIRDREFIDEKEYKDAVERIKKETF